jgi:hypothetical protein
MRRVLERRIDRLAALSEASRTAAPEFQPTR